MMPKLVMLAVLVVLILPPASSEDAAELETYLDCTAIKKVDIVFVFDTTNSMGVEIGELRAVANKFATGLEASNIDFQLGLVEFRDFPKTCDGFSCGSPGDFACQVKDNGTLTSDISTFSSWLKELRAGGGGSPGPEAVLTALRHAAIDITWRPDVEKAIIVLTDAGPHPDGSCCNAEGDTLEGTVFTLTDQEARVYVIGPDDASLKQIAANTGGQFYEIRSGLSLKPLLEKITQSMSCSFNVVVESACENKQLEATVQLVGKETIPYIAGQTEVWMYLDQAGSVSRYNLSYDSAEESYKAEMPGVCGPVEMTVYGRVGKRSAVQTVRVECGTCETTIAVDQGLSISGWIFNDSNGNGIKDVDESGFENWDVNLWEGNLTKNPPVAGVTYEVPVTKTDKNGFYIFSFNLPGIYTLTVFNDNWTATEPADGKKVVELVDAHESEINFGFRPMQNESLSSDMLDPFNRTFGGSGTDWISSGQPALDSGYIMAGYTTSFGKGGEDFWLLKTDSEGYESWNRTFGGAEDDLANSVATTADGGYILTGRTYSFGAGLGDAWLLKTDSEGDEIWNKTFGGPEHDMARSVLQSTDGGYILTGMTNSFGVEEYDAWLIRTDSEGNEIWNRTIRGKGSDEGEAVQPTADGGYIIAGWTMSSSSNDEAWLIKTDSKGNEVWSKTFGGDDLDRVWSIQPTTDGGYVLSGVKTTAGNQDAWLLKTDSEGNEVWNRTFSGSVQSAQPTMDGGYILVGSWLIKTDSEGNEIWNRSFGWTNAFAMSVQSTTDGCYILAGWRDPTDDSWMSGIEQPSADETVAIDMIPYDAWLQKVDAEGNVVQLSGDKG